MNAIVRVLSFVKCGEFLDWVRNWYSLKKDSALWSSLPLSYLFSPFVISYLLSVAPRVTETANEFSVRLKMK